MEIAWASNGTIQNWWNRPAQTGGKSANFPNVQLKGPWASLHASGNSAGGDSRPFRPEVAPCREGPSLQSIKEAWNRAAVFFLFRKIKFCEFEFAVADMKTRSLLGQETTLLKTRDVEIGIASLGGHLWPVKFRMGSRWVAPLSAAPWAAEKPSVPNILKVLRGDFFCMPFGGNETVYCGERHPPHGETANRKWKREPSPDSSALHFSLRTKLRQGRVDKFLHLVDGHPAIYQRHVISGLSGCMPVGYHAMLMLPSQGCACISTSPFVHGQVFPGDFENPVQGGYSCLQKGAQFTSIRQVPRADGGMADLSIYPAREGFEDLVMLVSDSTLPFAWTAAVVASEGWVWFSLKDPRVLRSTVFWMSNGGRHYPPWNGRHRRVIGLEEVTAFFHLGQAESALPNSLNKNGIPTCVEFQPNRATAINNIIAVAPIPSGFDEVRQIRKGHRGKFVELESHSGKTIRVPLDTDFLAAG